MRTPPKAFPLRGAAAPGKQSSGLFSAKAGRQPWMVACADITSGEGCKQHRAGRMRCRRWDDNNHRMFIVAGHLISQARRFVLHPTNLFPRLTASGAAARLPLKICRRHIFRAFWPSSKGSLLDTFIDHIEVQQYYMSASAWRAAWQQMFTATGIPAMWVGAEAMFTARAVVLPPMPAGPMPRRLMAARASASIWA